MENTLTSQREIANQIWNAMEFLDKTIPSYDLYLNLNPDLIDDEDLQAYIDRYIGDLHIANKLKQ